MFIHEYGSREDPSIILLAPMMVSGEDLYNLMARHLQRNYHIIAPDQGGHGKAGPYISAEEEYKALCLYLLEHHYTNIALLYGASLGAAVAYRLFFNPLFHIKKAWFDGLALSRNAFLAERMMKHLFYSRKKKLSKTHAEASPPLVKVYGYDFAKMMTGNFERITTSDIDAICRACCHYDLRRLTEEEQRKLHLDFGEKDFDMKYSRKTVPVYMPHVELTIRPGYSHCGYMASHTKEYVEEIEAFVRREGQ